MRPHRRLLLCGILLVASGAATRLPGQATPIRGGTDTLTIWLIRGGDTLHSGRIIDDLVIDRGTGSDRFIRTYTTESSIQGNRVDTIVDLVAGLTPDRAVAVHGDSAYRLDFSEGRVSGDLQLATGARRSIDLSVPVGVINSASFDLMLRGSLLRVGDSLHAVAFAPAVFGGVARLSARVDGVEEVEGRTAWRVVGVFPPGMRVTFWIDQRTRGLVMQRLELPGGIEILMNHRQPRLAPPPRRLA